VVVPDRQSTFVEQVIVSIRRECTDPIIPAGEKYLLRTLREHAGYSVQAMEMRP